MTNIRNYNFSGIDFRVSNSEYYDFFLNTDGFTFNGKVIGDWDFPDMDDNDWLTSSFDSNQYLISSFDFNNYSGQTLINQISANTSYEVAISESFTANTFGLTGLDNGAIFYDKDNDNFGHTDLLDKLTGTTLIHASGDTRLYLNKVSGYTGNITYPLELVINSGITGNYINLCGGFYQGYYKLDGLNYQVLPTRYETGWAIASWLKKSDSICSGATGVTLNDLYPDNKGFFYYSGTRAENKFWNIFSGNTSGCTSGSTDFCMDVKETDVNINNIMVEGSGSTVSVPLSPPPIDVAIIKNQFLIFGRSNGVLCSNERSSDGYGQVRADRKYKRNQVYYSQIVREVQTNFTNPFLIFGRSNGVLCSNERSSDGYGQVRADRKYKGTSVPLTELDKDKDIIGNALGFRIKDDGSIGYRMLVLSADCKSVEVIEEYSLSGMVSDDQWQYIVVKWASNDIYNGCDLINGKPRKGRFKFYVNSFLIFVSKELEEFIPKRLDDFMEKQIGVPFNISIGGGTQGLLESMTFDGQDSGDLGLVIEQNFAGSFIGSISNFNLYDTSLNWCMIKDLYKDELYKFI